MPRAAERQLVLHGIICGGEDGNQKSETPDQGDQPGNGPRQSSCVQLTFANRRLLVFVQRAIGA